MSRQTLNLSNTFFFKKHSLSVFGLLSDLDYLTPGGLTLAQMEANPKSARPKTPATPGALEQKAGIHQKIGIVGASDTWNIGQSFELTSAVFYTANALQNPFITNYEQRNEQTAGYRLVLSKDSTKSKVLGRFRGIENRFEF